MKNRAGSGRKLFWVRAAANAGVVAGGVLAGTPAAAQTEAAAEDQASAELQAAPEEVGGIPDVVVTARKRVESTQDIPVAVTTMTGETLQRYDVTNLEKVAAISPQFVIGRAPSGSGATLVLRGVGSNSTSIGLEQSVAVVVDGVYYGQGRIINEGFFDLGRVELLKGPQALFFGKNATAGVVSITTADPTDHLEFRARGGYELEGENRVGEVVLSGPLTDTLSARLALGASDSTKGLFRNAGVPIVYTTTDRTTTAVPGVATPHPAAVADSDMPQVRDLLGRVTFKWEPSEATQLTLKGAVSDNESNSPGAQSVVYNCTRGFYQFDANLPCRRDFVVYQNRFPLAIANSIPEGRSNGDIGNEYRAYGTTATLEHEFENMTLTWVNNYNRNRNVFIFDADSAQSQISATQVWATERSTFYAYSSEARVLTDFEGPFNTMIGGYYQKTKRDYDAWTASGALENSAATPSFRRYLANSKDSQTDGETLALFAQLIWKVLPNVEVTAGARYTDETKESYFLQPYSHPIRVTQGIFLPGVTINSDQSFTDTSPEATITWQPSDEVTVYAAYKTGYKSGGFSNSGILSPTAGLADFEFEPETAEGVEIGIKTLLADRQLRLNVSPYYYEYSDLQLDFFRSDIFAFSTINAGSATTKGVELEYEFAPRAWPDFDVHGSVNYNRARYGNAPLAPCYQGQTPALGCTIVPGQGPRQNLRGLPTANAPLWTATLGFNYDTDVGGNMRFGISADARYSDDYLPTAFGNEASRQKSYVQLDASARLSGADDRWQLAVIGRNLTDRFYVTGGVDAPGTGSGTGTAAGVLGDQIGYIALPRTIQVQLTFQY